MMFQGIRSSILLKTTMLVLGVALGIGLVANEVVGRLAQRIEAARARDRIASLLGVVEPWAGAACYVGDKRVAQDTATGLLNSPSIAAVEIRGADGLIAEAWRPGMPTRGAVIIRPVLSPFAKNEIIGEIRVFPDMDETARSMSRYIWALRGLVLLLAAIVGLALALAIMRTMVQPIKQLSDKLNELDASKGMRLEFPHGHETDEIGRLVVKINVALEAEEQRYRLEQQVQQAQKLNSLGSLAGGVAHDFNNMLAGIMGYADLLYSEEQDPMRQQYLSAILTAASRSSELVAKLLAFGRRGKNLAQAVDLNATVGECISMLQPSMPMNLRADLQLEEGVHVDGDPSQISQVVLNLCINAVEAMACGGDLIVLTRTIQLAEPEASTHRLPPGSYGELKVSDTGPGIGQDVLERIFEPFFTTKTTGEKLGTGLGLATVYGIVEAHRGALEVDSTVGVGTTFRVLLPTGQISMGKPSQTRTPNRGCGVVLVVDDESTLREFAKFALESLGFIVETAENGREGVASFRASHGKLYAVLLDLKMPVMGGREAFEQMQLIDATVPVIICTGYGENEEVQATLSLGAIGMLSKPYRIIELSDALQKLKRKS
jgi:signal transduction histidine kinase/ActR/RegA family two-component response regulator